MTNLEPLNNPVEYARLLAAANMIPKAFQNNPANVLWALEYGRTLGLSPVEAMVEINVINGKPTASANLMNQQVRKHGHKMRITGDDTTAICSIWRKDDPNFEFRVEWTMDKAQKANLTNKDTWRQYPAAMLRARAVSECIRMACPEVMSGAIYTAEELEPVIVSHETIKPVETTWDTLAANLPKPAAIEAEPEVEVEPLDNDSQPWPTHTQQTENRLTPTAAQINLLNNRFKALEKELKFPIPHAHRVSLIAAVTAENGEFSEWEHFKRVAISKAIDEIKNETELWQTVLTAYINNRLSEWGTENE